MSKVDHVLPAFSLSNVEIPVDDDFAWLAALPPVPDWPISAYESHDSDLSIAEKIDMICSDQRYKLPKSFVNFIKNPDLHLRIRSSTACFLEFPNYVVETGGVEHGYLIHFLSDQQWHPNWYLWVNDAGEERVLLSPWIFGFDPDEFRDGDIVRTASDFVSSTPQPEEMQEPTFDAAGLPNLAAMRMTIYAPTFAEFIYRYWIGEEIWFANVGKQPFSPLQQRYLDGFKR